MPLKQPPSSLIRYSALAFEFLGGIAAGVLGGIWADEYFHLDTPLFTWLAPLLILVTLCIKLIKETSPHKNDKNTIN